MPTPSPTSVSPPEFGRAARTSGRARRRLARLLALALLALPAGAREVPITLLHTADLHGRLVNLVPQEGFDRPAGLLRLATLIRAARAEAPNVLLLDAGDTIQGSPESYATRGRAVVEAMEQLRFDAWTLGNHEFDWGLETLAALVEGTPVPVLAANLRPLPGSPHPLPAVRSHIVVERDGVRILVVGLTTPGIPRWSLPELIGTLRFPGGAETLRALLPALRAEAADIWVLLVHQGYRGGQVDHANEVRDLVRGFPEFDVVIGGHTHEFVPGLAVGGTLYAQAGYHGAALGRVDLVYDTVARRVVRKEGRLIPVQEETPEDPELRRLFGPVVEQARARLDRRVGSLAAPVGPRDGPPGQSGVERLLRGAIAEAVGAEVVVHGALSSAALPAGPVTERDLWRLVPYENRIGVAYLTAGELREILEEVLARSDERTAMGIGGLRATLRPGAAAGRRVRALRLPDGSAAHPRRRFRVAFNSFTLASAGGRYPRLRQLALRPEARFELTAIETRDALRAYLARHPDADFGSPPTDGFFEEP